MDNCKDANYKYDDGDIYKNVNDIYINDINYYVDKTNISGTIAGEVNPPCTMSDTTVRHQKA